MADEPISNPIRPQLSLMGGPNYTVPFVNGSGAVQMLGLGSAGTVLMSNGPTANPSFAGGATLALALPVMIGATNVLAGAKGSVPQPTAGDQLKFLRGDATWQPIPLMSGASAGAPGIAGLVPAPATGYQNRYLRGDGTWQIVAGTGTVVEVGITAPIQFLVTNSPITVSGTIDLAWDVAAANVVLAGPVAGAPDVPVFRGLVVNDIPGLPWSKITSGTPTTLAGYGITDGLVANASVVSISAGNIGARPAAGTLGRVYISLDTGVISYDNGTIWLTEFPALTGDVTTTLGGVATTIAANAVTNAKLAQAGSATFKGNPTGGIGNVQDMSAATATGLLSVMIGATNVSAGAKGLVPLPSAGDDVRFLRGDGSWAVAGGTLTGGGTANQIAYWSGPTALTGSSIFTLAGTTLIMAGPIRSYGQQVATASYSTNQVLTIDNFYVRYIGAGGDTFTLPSCGAAGAGSTILLLIRNVGAGPLTVVPAGVDTIDTGSSVVLLPGQGIELAGDGSSSWDTN